MLRMAAMIPAGWQVDTENIGNEHGKPKIQSCNACVSSSMALCVWPCNCYGPYGQLARGCLGDHWSRQLVRPPATSN
jgi:hypothetical protein